MSKAKSNRIRKPKQQKQTTCNLDEIKKAIKKAQKNKQGLDEQFIHTYLKCVPSFIGCFEIGRASCRERV